MSYTKKEEHVALVVIKEKNIALFEECDGDDVVYVLPHVILKDQEVHIKGAEQFLKDFFPYSRAHIYSKEYKTYNEEFRILYVFLGVIRDPLILNRGANLSVKSVSFYSAGTLGQKNLSCATRQVIDDYRASGHLL